MGQQPLTQSLSLGIVGCRSRPTYFSPGMWLACGGGGMLLAHLPGLGAMWGLLGSWGFPGVEEALLGCSRNLGFCP